MMSDDHFIAINSEKPNKKGKMLKHLFWSTLKIKSKFVSHRFSEKPSNHYHWTPSWPPHSSLKRFHAAIPSRNDFINMTVGFNTKSIKPDKKAFVLFYCDVLVPAHGLDIDQDRSQRCERTALKVKGEPI